MSCSTWVTVQRNFTVWFLLSIIRTVRNSSSAPKAVAPRNWNPQYREYSLSQTSHDLVYNMPTCYAVFIKSVSEVWMVRRSEEDYAKLYIWFTESYDPENKIKWNQLQQLGFIIWFNSPCLWRIGENICFSVPSP